MVYPINNFNIYSVTIFDQALRGFINVLFMLAELRVIKPTMINGCVSR